MAKPTKKNEDGLTPQQRYYRKMKDDPEYRKKNQAARKAYYERNREVEQEKSLDRYYAKKAVSSQKPEES